MPRHRSLRRPSPSPPPQRPSRARPERVRSRRRRGRGRSERRSSSSLEARTREATAQRRPPKGASRNHPSAPSFPPLLPARVLPAHHEEVIPCAGDVRQSKQPRNGLGGAKRTSAGGLAGPSDALLELSRRRLGLRTEVAAEHRLESLVVTHRERVIARFVMRAHQQTMRFLVVRLELQKLLEWPDRRLGFLPLALERRELLRGRDKLTVRFLALPIDPWGGQVREKFAAMDRHCRPQVLDRLARSTGFLRLATAAQRAVKDLEVDVDRDRKREPVAGVCAYDARGLRRTRRCERLPQSVE